MNQFIKKLFGLDKIENEVAEATKSKIEAEAAADAAKEKERLAKLTPKELATERKEPWVAVLETHVNKENIRNGFFELDWNEYFVLELVKTGYKGSSEEEIVDSWFSDLCRNIGKENGIDMERRGSGFVNKALRDDGKTEIS
jgi:hypothetical protein